MNKIAPRKRYNLKDVLRQLKVAGVMLIQFIYAIMTMTESMTIREKQKYHRVETGKVESKHLS